jgi:hypothetical protein
MLSTLHSNFVYCVGQIICRWQTIPLNCTRKSASAKRDLHSLNNESPCLSHPIWQEKIPEIEKR